MKERRVYPGCEDGGIDRPTVCEEKSLTRQSEMQGADINAIMQRYEKTGVLPMDVREAVFTDVSEIGSFRDALEIMRAAERGFMELSPAMREKFGNDPVAFLDFASRPENRPELEKLGVLAAPEGAPIVEKEPPAAAVAQ